jgi:hypothetical protein
MLLIPKVIGYAGDGNLKSEKTKNFKAFFKVYQNFTKRFK